MIEAAGESGKVVYLGRSVGPTCQACGLYERTNRNHVYCAQNACPIAQGEFRRRERPRTVAAARKLAERAQPTVPADEPGLAPAALPAEGLPAGVSVSMTPKGRAPDL